MSEISEINQETSGRGGRGVIKINLSRMAKTYYQK